MGTMDGEVQRRATQRVWSEDEGQCIVASWHRGIVASWRRGGVAAWRRGGVAAWRRGGGVAEWRVACGVRAPLRHRGAPALLSDHDDGRARSRARTRIGRVPSRARAAGARRRG